MGPYAVQLHVRADGPCSDDECGVLVGSQSAQRVQLRLLVGGCADVQCYDRYAHETFSDQEPWVLSGLDLQAKPNMPLSLMIF